MPALDSGARAKFSRMEQALLRVHDQLLAAWAESFAAGQTWSAASLDGLLGDLAATRARLLEARRAWLMTNMDPREAAQALGTHAYRARALSDALGAIDRPGEAVAPLGDVVNDLVSLLDALPARSQLRSTLRNLRVI